MASVFTQDRLAKIINIEYVRTGLKSHLTILVGRDER